MLLEPVEEMVEKMLRRDEGEKLKVYPDSRGHPSIGVGRCLDTKGISAGESAYLLYGDILDAKRESLSIEGFRLLSVERQAVVLSMLFQLGFDGVKGFKLFLEALRQQNWPRAAAEMRASDWYTETPHRAERLAVQMETGVYQP